MKTLNIRQFRASVGQLDQLVEKSGEIIITRNGKRILRVLPMHEKHMRPDHKDLRSKMPLLKTLSSTHIRQERVLKSTLSEWVERGSRKGVKCHHSTIGKGSKHISRWHLTPFSYMTYKSSVNHWDCQIYIQCVT